MQLAEAEEKETLRYARNSTYVLPKGWPIKSGQGNAVRSVQVSVAQRVFCTRNTAIEECVRITVRYALMLPPR